MATREHFFGHPSELDALSTLPFVRPSNVPTIRLGGTLTNNPARRGWEQELNRQVRACGCEVGAIGVLVGGLAGTGWVVFSHARGNPIWATPAIVILATAFGGALVGKLIGLVRANRRLKRTIEKIQQLWIPEPVPPTPLGTTARPTPVL